MKWFKITCEQVEQLSISIQELKKLICDYNKRDFYFLDNRINFDISSLIIKKECLIGKFDHIKAVIFSKHAYLINDNFNFNDFQHFKEDSKSPCHLIILEFIFHQVLESFDKEFSNCFDSYLQVSDKYDINYSFIQLQTSLLNLEYRVKEFKNIPENLLENNEDLHQLTYDLIAVEDLEQIIENYDLKLDDIYNDISKLLREMDNAQKIANIKLAKDRNKYALFNLYISFVSLSFSFGSWIGSLFGMNVDNHIEDSPYSFWTITGTSCVIMCTIIISQCLYLKQV